MNKYPFHSILYIPFFFITLFSDLEEPNIKKSVSIGNYTAGCIKNSTTLPIDGFGYQVIRTSRNSNYGHNKLIDLIDNLASEIKSTYNLRLLIGDISNKNGGPMPKYHNSHQTGLDVDILYIHKNSKKNYRYSIEEREKIYPKSVLNESETAIDPNKWNHINGEVLKLASLDNEVDRIFVNPLIKQKLCSIYSNQKWLRKVRPWTKHDGHFHLRLKCPNNSVKCRPGPIIPEGTGCGKDLKKWFSLKKHKTSSKNKPQIAPPKECEKILSSSVN